MNQEELKEKWFKNDISYTLLDTVKKEELIYLLWYVRGYFDYEITKRGKDK